jgi:hypothetical protein
VGIEGGSFFDAILRGFFGYHPDIQWPAVDKSDKASIQRALIAALFDPTTPRGFEGTLSNLRTPVGMATITSSSSGLTIALQ